VDQLLEIAETLSALGILGILALSVWKGGAAVAWFKQTVSHLAASVDRIEGKVDEYNTENKEEHKAIRGELGKLPPKWLVDRVEKIEDRIEDKC
jgi:hypothetical protein